MTRPVLMLVAGLVLLGGVGLSAGGNAIGRVIAGLGLPGLSLALLDRPEDRGQALHRTGRHAEAAAAFDAAGSAYNHGVAAARAGDYATALVAWERALAQDPGDRQAAENHALVTAILSGTRFDAVAAPDEKDPEGAAVLAPPGQGKARAAGTGDEANNPTSGFWMPELGSSGLRRVPKMFDAQYIAANERWLTTLEDQPGQYLRARLLAEHKARVADGAALPEAEDPE